MPAFRKAWSRFSPPKSAPGLDRKRYVDLEAISDIVDSPEDNARAQEIANRAVTLVRNTGDAVPLAAPDQRLLRGAARKPVFRRRPHPDAGDSQAGADASIMQADPSMTRETLDEAMGKLQTCGSFVVAAFSSVNSGSGAGGLAGDLPHVIESLIASGKPVTLVALGESLFVAQFSKSNGVSGDVQHCAAFGNRSGESAVGRNRNPRTLAGDHSGVGQLWRRNCDCGEGGPLTKVNAPAPTKYGVSHPPLAFDNHRGMLSFTLPPPGIAALLLALVIAAAAYDVPFRRIPNWLTATGVLLGLAMNTFLYQGWPGLKMSLIGLAVSFGVYFVLYSLRAMGAGDVKLMAAIGAMVGWQDWFGIFLVTALIGGVASLVLIALRRRFKKTMWNVGFVLTEMKNGRAAYLSNEELDVRSPKAIGLPHGAVIAAGTLAFLGLSIHFGA